MADPIGFSAATARFDLPFLHTGQTQKEIFVNEAHVILDALLHPVVQGIVAQPPQAPKSGECWIVGADADGLFAGQENKIACYHEAQWIFTSLVTAMRVYNLASASYVCFLDGWDVAPAIAIPSGGETIDVEARAAIMQIADALNRAGLTA